MTAVTPEDPMSTEFAPIESGTPETGFIQAPLTPQDRGGPGPGVPANRRTIH